MELLNTLFYFLIVIGILVFVHEFGHFIAARLTGMRAEVFALGIGYRLFGYNKINGFTFGKLSDEIELNDKTDYRICAFPIGGYVKVAGMIDESMDKEFLNNEPQPWEYRAKPVWKRMIVITAGVIMNFLLAFVIFYCITLFKGSTKIDTTTIGYISQKGHAANSGLKQGDKIISINNAPVESWDDVDIKLNIENIGEALNIVVHRNGKDQLISIPKSSTADPTELKFGLYPEGMIPEVKSVVSDKPAQACGLQPGDVITYLNGIRITNAVQLSELIRENANKPIHLKWQRNSEEMSCNMTTALDSTIGISYAAFSGQTKETKYNFISAFPQAWNDLYFGVEMLVKSISKIIKGDIPFKKAIGGPIKIAQISAQSAEGGIYTFLQFLALLSISLAVINILPFPALDGGHFMMLLYEGIARKPVPYKVQVILQNVGFALLLAFMMFVVYNDIISFK